MLEDIDDSDPEYGLTARDIQALPSTEAPQTNHNPWSFFLMESHDWSSMIDANLNSAILAVLRNTENLEMR